MKKYIINKKLVQLMFLVLLIFVLFVWATTGFKDLRKPYIYVECPEHSFGPCDNPYYYECSSFVVNDYCDNLNPSLYADPFILPGESLGKEAPFLVENSIFLMIFIMVIFLAINTKRFNKK